MTKLRLRRTMTAFVALVAVAAMGACGGSGSDAGGDALDAPGAEVLEKASGKTTIEFWHSMKGANAEAVDQLVADFNAQSGGKVEVKAVFQGSYDETIAKYKASVQQKSTPALVQIYDIGTRFMVDSKQVVPMYKFAEKDSFNTADIEPNIANYYSIDGKLWSMPFNSSTPLLYLNKEAFERARLDPTKPPRTLTEIGELAKKLTVKDAGGKTIQYGFGAAIYGWLLEQLLATDGKEYCDHGNGRAGLASKVQFDQESAVRVAQWWADLVKGGYATNTGRKTDDAQAAFKAGTVAMHLESTSVLRGYVDAAKGKFTVLTAPYPKLDSSSAGGPIIGGASLWIGGVGHSAQQKRAAWEFVKFASSPAAQAKWHTGTGYVPINSKALDEQIDKDWMAKFPQFRTAVDQLHALPPSVASAGCLLGVMPQARKASEDGLEAAIVGSKPAEQAMKDAAASVQGAIDGYNKSVG
ncbi:ABC transporter substrate-binding protein [Micromonospora sp. DR5-3]|uniref:ABC transporter substrate-binding protein n=1 Tax=unclassified Micromonospora TaxID=2617518 RepID=UPI0011DBEBF0|nr:MULTISPECIES: ABC transporter substrate-binding protein [unclassified Micromonospora]MCW3816138.1 ABC transporter substrate-binding protein [Micromonospora sp. DR5-3]TYC19236.1 ABC transporter substrate-binding protein [Micromonospora sp. MP36]